MSNIAGLLDHGQSLWLDYIDRNLITGGGLKELVALGVRGVTSNPTIFHKAITGSDAYDEAIRELLQADPNLDDAMLYHWLTIQDIQNAADILRPVYDQSHGGDGYVSLEVSPHLAYDTQGTIDAARHLWKEVHRPNLMIKVPGTKEGVPAFEKLVSEGININVTLLFSVRRYEEVARAWTRALAMNPEPAGVASVASFFVSRVDNKVDAELEHHGTDEALAMRGRAAIANAKLAYECFRSIIAEPEFREQQARGGSRQRVLWGSTSTKNPDYRDVRYVEELIGADTVNTVPVATLEAFQHHGEVRRSLDDNVAAARRDMDGLARVGIDMERVTAELEAEGVRAFADSHDQLLAALGDKRLEVTRDYASG